MFCFYKRIGKLCFFIGSNGVEKNSLMLMLVKHVNNIFLNKTNKIIKRKLLNSYEENDDVEQQGLNETVNNINNSQEAILLIHHYER